MFYRRSNIDNNKKSIRLQMAPEMMATNEASEYEAREFQSQRPTHQSRTSGSWILELRNGRNSFHYRQMVLVAGTGSGLNVSRSMLPTTKGKGTMWGTDWWKFNNKSANPWNAIQPQSWSTGKNFSKLFWSSQINKVVWRSKTGVWSFGHYFPLATRARRVTAELMAR